VTAPAHERPVVGVLVHGHDGKHPGSAFVRVVLRARWAARRGLLSHRVLDVEQVVADGLPRDLDVLLVQRDALLTPESARAVLADADVRGIPVVLDLDDDLVTGEARNRLQALEYSAERLAALDETLTAAATVVVTTDELAGRLRSVVDGVHVATVPNALDPGLWGSTTTFSAVAPAEGEPRALYMGSHTHGADLELLRQVPSAPGPALDVLGVTSDAGSWYETMALGKRAMPYPLLVTHLRRGRRRWTVALAPLVDEHFNAAKSDLKFLEYSAMGLPTVASARGPYAGAGQHGAFLVDGGVDEWRETVRTVLADEASRIDHARRAEAYVRDQRLYRLDDGWLDAITGASRH